MNPNDVLASIAGITGHTDFEEQETHQEEYEEISYEDVDAELLDLPENQSHEQQDRSRKSKMAWQRELQSLQFMNPGDETSKFLPDSSDIINTNRARRVHADKPADLKEELIHHDKTGKLSSTTKGHTETFDLCDCLNEECSGCHWPCATCSSRKCLVGCRQNRKEMVAKVEDMYTPEGTSGHLIRTNPYFPLPIKD
uniref:ARF7EP_C domain-containing protein n=1 Tax=Caenorhabditis tropicalis TaxID=1561998 RepID=A0A1I7UMF1_9PELO